MAGSRNSTRTSARNCGGVDEAGTSVRRSRRAIAGGASGGRCRGSQVRRDRKRRVRLDGDRVGYGAFACAAPSRAPGRHQGLPAHRATDIWMAASGPPAAFGKAAMAALRLSEGKQGASVPREYSKLRGHSVLLGVYEELKARHGSPEHAHERMASELGCKARSVEARVTQARNALGVLLGNSLHGFSELDAGTAGILGRTAPAPPESHALQRLEGTAPASAAGTKHGRNADPSAEVWKERLIFSAVWPRVSAHRRKVTRSAQRRTDASPAREAR